MIQGEAELRRHRRRQRPDGPADTTGGDTSDNTGEWNTNTFNAAVDRVIALMDVGIVGRRPDAGTSGNDSCSAATRRRDLRPGRQRRHLGRQRPGPPRGQRERHGQSATNPDPDVRASDWPSFAGDVIHGDAGADDIAGGTGWIFRMVGLGVRDQERVVAAVTRRGVVGTDGRLDGDDTLFGDGGGDSIAGDNTVIERALQAASWIRDDVRDTDARAECGRRRPADHARARRRDDANTGSPATASAHERHVGRRRHLRQRRRGRRLRPGRRRRDPGQRGTTTSRATRATTRSPATRARTT